MSFFNYDTLQTIAQCFSKAVRPAMKTTAWLLRIMIPITLAVRLMQFFGVIEWMAGYLDPIFTHIGLPGYSAIAYLTGAFVTTYACVAVMLTMALTMREATIVAVMVLICHALPLESAVVRKTGSSFWRMAVIRIVAAFLAGAYLNAVLPEAVVGSDMAQMFLSMTGETPLMAGSDWASGLLVLLQDWLWQTVKMSVMIASLILALMTVQRIMEAYDMMRRLSKVLSPLMRIFGLPGNAAYMWVVGNVLGISYGSAVMVDLEEQGVITREEANDVNYHLIMNHSMLEDTCVFAAFGISAWWILSTRILFAMALVWGRKAIVKKNKN